MYIALHSILVLFRVRELSKHSMHDQDRHVLPFIPIEIIHELLRSGGRVAS